MFTRPWKYVIVFIDSRFLEPLLVLGSEIKVGSPAFEMFLCDVVSKFCWIVYICVCFCHEAGSLKQLIGVGILHRL